MGGRGALSEKKRWPMKEGLPLHPTNAKRSLRVPAHLELRSLPFAHLSRGGVEYFQRVVRTGITVTGRDVKAGPNLASVDRPGRDALFADAKRSSVHAAGTGLPPGAVPSMIMDGTVPSTASSRAINLC